MTKKIKFRIADSKAGEFQWEPSDKVQDVLQFVRAHDRAVGAAGERAIAYLIEKFLLIVSGTLDSHPNLMDLFFGELEEFLNEFNEHCIEVSDAFHASRN